MMKLFLLSLVISLVAAAPAFPQQPPGRFRSQTVATPAHEDTAEGLRLLLQDVLAAAKAGDQARLSAIVKELEIPDYETWFIKAFGQDQGEKRAIPYGANLAQDQREFQNLFLQLAKQDGQFSTRSVIDAMDRRSGLEASMIDTLQRPVDIFFATWNGRDAAPGSASDPVGYFFYIDGKFRWDSTIRPAKPAPRDNFAAAAAPGASQKHVTGEAVHIQGGQSSGGAFRPGVNGVGYPSCKSCPDPRFPTAARREGKEGLVVLEAIVQPDGRATDIHVLKSPRPDFADRAVEAVETWVFNPAIGPNGAPVAVVVPIEVKFSLVH